MFVCASATAFLATQLAHNSRYSFTQACGGDNSCSIIYPVRCSCRLHPSPSASDVSQSHGSRRNFCPPKTTKWTHKAVSARMAARQVATGAGYVQQLGTWSCPPACTRSKPQEPSEFCACAAIPRAPVPPPSRRPPPAARPPLPPQLARDMEDPEHAAWQCSPPCVTQRRACRTSDETWQAMSDLREWAVGCARGNI